MIITRPQLPASGPITRADLNNLNDLVIALEQTDVDTLETIVPNINYVRNADFSLWTRGTSAVALSHGVRTERADHWWARADYGLVGSGGAGTFATYLQAPDTAHQQWLYCAKLTGALFASNLDFGQDLPARVAAGLEPKITLTLEVENDTGASITPVVRVDTCDTFESWGAVTNRIAQPVPTALPNATRVTWTVTIDASGFLSSLRNGAQIYVRFTGLNDAAKFVKIFTAKLEVGETATERVVERDVETVIPAASAGSERQYLDNGNFAQWWTDSATVPLNKDTYAAPNFWAFADAGATLVYRKSTSVPDNNSLFCAELVGDAAVTASVNFGANLLRSLTAEMRRNVVFSCQIYNDTGAPIQPNLRIDCCTSPDTFDSVANEFLQDLDICADGAWTKVSVTFDGSTVTNFELGARLYLNFFGFLTANTKKIRVAQMRIERGTVASTFIPVPELEPAAALGAVARGLKVKWVDNGHLDVSFDECVVTDRGGRGLRLLAQTFAGVALGTSGANGLDYAQPADASTWHYLWVASTGEAHCVFISKSASEPTLNTGYLFKARIGAFPTTATPDIPALAIMGRRHFCGAGLSPNTGLALNNVTVGTAATFQSLDLSAFVPPEAVAVFGSAGIHSAEDCRMAIAGSDGAADVSAGVGVIYICGTGGSTAAVINGFRVCAPFEVALRTAQTLFWTSLVRAATSYRMVIAGWEMP